MRVLGRVDLDKLPKGKVPIMEWPELTALMTKELEEVVGRSARRQRLIPYSEDDHTEILDTQKMSSDKNSMDL